MLITTDSLIDYSRLLDLVEAGRARARRHGRSILVSHTERVAGLPPLAFFEAGRVLDDHAFYWEYPARSFALAAIGAAYLIETAGAGRFERVAAAWRELREHALIDGLNTMAGSGPTLLGGFAFDPDCERHDPAWREFAPSSALLPRLQLTVTGEIAALTFNVVVDPATTAEALTADVFRLYEQALQNLDMPPARSRQHASFATADVMPAAEWQAVVAATTAAIRAGVYEKVALALALELTSSEPIQIGRALEFLRTHYTGAYTFAVQRGAACFLGATPERLVGLHSGLVSASALAGTAPRGANEEDDLRHGQELLASAKNRHEHAVVVDMVREMLGKVCVDLHAPREPALLKLPNVQHLHTPVSGRLRAGHTLLDLVALLHPTPAVGGIPRDAALAHIRACERLDRGWYAAPVGWIDARGEGDWAVALRSGVVTGNHALLFAGCGIVGDSDPAAEYVETRLKLRPMLAALGATAE